MPEAHEMPSDMPVHLGGGERRCHDDEGALRYMVEKYSINSMVDVGCGRGCQLRIGNSLGLKTLGVDGDQWLSGKFWGPLNILVHDYTTGPSKINEMFDLAWTVEFLEHVEEKYIPNYFPDLQKAKYVICTYAPPGKGGHHHVNCQPGHYWVEKFKDYGFDLIPEDTEEIRKRSTMRKNFIRQYGLVFKNIKV